MINNRRKFLTVILVIAACLALPELIFAQEHKIAGRKPNVIIVITDDQGMGDLACHGNPIIKTPNIDDFYSESVRFTNFHVSTTCAPTRGALMTGRHTNK